MCVHQTIHRYYPIAFITILHLLYTPALTLHLLYARPGHLTSAICTIDTCWLATSTSHVYPLFFVSAICNMWSSGLWNCHT